MASIVAARALKKFHELDTDGSGYLEGEELMLLADWTWRSFHPDGKPINDTERAALAEKLLHRIDENNDSRLSAKEFEEYFTKTADAIGRFRRRPSQLIYSKLRNGQPKGPPKFQISSDAYPISNESASVTTNSARAMKKFNEFDADGNGFLEGDELVQLAEWVWASFHPSGNALDESERAAMIDKLLHRIDENEDGRLSAKEFEAYFVTTASAIGRFRRRPSQLNSAKLGAGSAAKKVAAKGVDLFTAAPLLPAEPAAKIAFSPMDEAIARAEREAKAAQETAEARKTALQKWGVLKTSVDVATGGASNEGEGEWVACPDYPGGRVRVTSKHLQSFGAVLQAALKERRTSFAAVPQEAPARPPQQL